MGGPSPDDLAIRNSYVRLQRAIQSKNMNAVSDLLTPDFIQENADHRKMNRRVFLRSFRQSIGPLQDVKVRLTVMDVRTSGRRATCEMRYTLDGKVKDKTGRHSIHVEGSETDLYRKMGRRWLQAYAKEHDSSTSVDGRVVEHSP